MSASRHQRLVGLFARASELPADQRESFLERECAEDPDLRAELSGLLALDDVVGDATLLLVHPVRAEADVIPQSLGYDDPQPTFHLKSTIKAETSGAAVRSSEQYPTISGFRLLRRLGSGGAGSVFTAHDEKMNRQVALKVLNSPTWLAKNLDRRFEREAWIAGRLSHPNIVKVYERGVSEGVGFYTMDLVDGGSLHDVIHGMREAGRDDRLGLEFGSREYMQWALQQIVVTSRALDYAHGQGVVHRDVKPMNLLLGGEPAQVRIADFGIAMDEEATRLTTEGQVIGTLRYMSPEQLRGRTAEIDRRTDVYALGVTLFELLTLEYPYRGDTYERYMSAVLNEEARRPSRINNRVSRDLEIVIGKALEKDPRDRYSTAGELAEDLENVMHFRPIEAQPVGTVDRLIKWARRKPMHAAFALALVIGVPTLGGVGAWALHQHRLLEQQLLDEQVERLNEVAIGGDDLRVLDIADGILELDPDHPDGLRSRATSNFNLSLFEPEGSPEREQYLEVAFANVDRWIRVSPDSARPVMLKAYFLSWLGRVEEAKRLEESAPDSIEDSDDALFHRAHLANLKGEWALAEKLLSDLLLRKRRTDAYQNRANVRIKLEDLEGARRDLDMLAAMDPDDADAPRGLGKILMKQGEFEEAERQLLHALELDGTDVRIHEALSDNSIQWAAKFGDRDAEAARERLRQAERYARDGLEIDADAPWLLVNLALSLVERYRSDDSGETELLEEAAEYNERAARVASPARPTANLNRCDQLILLRRLESARLVCETYVALRPEDPLGHYNLAAVHALSGRHDEALEALERDFELGDNEWKYLRDDDWFESLRENPEFRDLLDQMQRRAETGN